MLCSLLGSMIDLTAVAAVVAVVVGVALYH